MDALKKILPTIRLRISYVSFALLLMIINAPLVFACSCATVSTCERFNFSDRIFVGKAVSVEQINKGEFKTETTVFEVSEVFSGEKVTSLRVQNKIGLSCDVEFTVGETYLVFANGDKPVTGSCSGNRPIEYATAEIAELRKRSRANGNGKLLGSVLEKYTKREKDKERAPIKDVRVEAIEASTGRKYVANTDAKGRYEISVPPGVFTVTPIVPPNAVLPQTFELKPMGVKSGGCVEGYFVLFNKSLVAGRLVDGEGKPIPNARVELIFLDETSSYYGELTDRSNADGEFSIDEIPAGKYTLSINYDSNPEPDTPFPTTFYPSGSDRTAAKVLEIKPGGKIEGLAWSIPKRLDEQSIKGKVLWEDGSAVQGAEMRLFDMAFPDFFTGCYLGSESEIPGVVTFNLSGPACELKSNSVGEFQLKAYAGRTYRIGASLNQTVSGQKVSYEATSEPIALASQPQNVILIIKKK